MKNIIKLGSSVVILLILFSLQPVGRVLAEPQVETAAAAGETVLSLAAAPWWAQIMVAVVAGLAILLALAPAAGLTSSQQK